MYIIYLYFNTGFRYCMYIIYICISILYVYIICIFKPFLFTVSTSCIYDIIYMIYTFYMWYTYGVVTGKKHLYSKKLPLSRKVLLKLIFCMYLCMILLSSRRGLEVRRDANHHPTSFQFCQKSIRGPKYSSLSAFLSFLNSMRALRVNDRFF